MPDLRVDLGEAIKNGNFHRMLLDTPLYRSRGTAGSGTALTQALSTFRVERATSTRFGLHAGKIIFNTYNEESE